MLDKILIVDDDAEFRQELRDYLDDYEVVEASKIADTFLGNRDSVPSSR